MFIRLCTSVFMACNFLSELKKYFNQQVPVQLSYTLKKILFPVTFAFELKEKYIFKMNTRQTFFHQGKTCKGNCKASMRWMKMGEFNKTRKTKEINIYSSTQVFGSLFIVLYILS